MAFYFALLNVSAKKEETKKDKNRRRRHSIASVESPLLDYRLLPRPQVMGEDDDKRKHELRGMKKSESNYSTGRRRTPERKGNKSKSREHSFRDEPRDSGSSAFSDLDTHRERKKKEQDKLKGKRNLPHLLRQKKFIQPNLHPPPNSPAVVGNISPEFLGPSSSKKEGPRSPGRIRPLFRRRQSPPDSTTSGSRRSSKGSQNSTPRRDTPSSSSCSRRESEEPAQNAITSLAQASQKLAGVHITRPQDKFHNLKKVTFNGSPLVIRNNFLGERAILVQKGGQVLRRSSTAAQPLAACGVDWWGLIAEAAPPGEGENVTNSAIEDDSKLNLLRPSLLRRRSTSDRGRVAFVLQNDGFLSEQEEKDLRNGNHPGVCLLKRAGTTKG